MQKSAAEQFVDLWQTGACDDDARRKLLKILNREELCGRMIHGFPKWSMHFDVNSEPFGAMLSDRFWKRCSWVFGPDALEKFLGKSSREICLQLGFGEHWLDAKLAQGK